MTDMTRFDVLNLVKYSQGTGEPLHASDVLRARRVPITPREISIDVAAWDEGFQQGRKQGNLQGIAIGALSLGGLILVGLIVVYSL